MSPPAAGRASPPRSIAPTDTRLCKAPKINCQAHAAQLTSALGTTSVSDRQQGTCAICGDERVVTRSKRI